MDERVSRNDFRNVTMLIRLNRKRDGLIRLLPNPFHYKGRSFTMRKDFRPKKRDNRGKMKPKKEVNNEKETTKERHHYRSYHRLSSKALRMASAFRVSSFSSPRSRFLRSYSFP